MPSAPSFSEVGPPDEFSVPDGNSFVPILGRRATADGSRGFQPTVGNHANQSRRGATIESSPHRWPPIGCVSPFHRIQSSLRTSALLGPATVSELESEVRTTSVFLEGGQRLWTAAACCGILGSGTMIGECSVVRTAGSMVETNNSRGVPRHVWSAVARHSFGLRRSCFFVGDASNAECRLSAQKSEAASSGRIPSILVMSTHGSASWLAGESGSRLPQSRVLRTVIRNQLQLATLGLGTMLGHLHRRSVGQQVWISRSGHELIVFGMASNPDPLNPVWRIDTDGPSV